MLSSRDATDLVQDKTDWPPLAEMVHLYMEDLTPGVEATANVYAIPDCSGVNTLTCYIIFSTQRLTDALWTCIERHAATVCFISCTLIDTQWRVSFPAVACALSSDHHQ